MSVQATNKPRLSTLTWKPLTEEEIPQSSRALTLRDRCDACSAAAYVRATKGDSELLFCGNHGRRSHVALREQGWEVDDQTDRVFAKPSDIQDS